VQYSDSTLNTVKAELKKYKSKFKIHIMGFDILKRASIQSLGFSVGKHKF